MSGKDEFEKYSEEDSTGYVDWSKAKLAGFPKLKPSLKTISIRLPEAMIVQLKSIANRSDVPYQSLIKLYLKERIGRELG